MRCDGGGGDAHETSVAAGPPALPSYSLAAAPARNEARLQPPATAQAVPNPRAPSGCRRPARGSTAGLGAGPMRPASCVTWEGAAHHRRAALDRRLALRGWHACGAACQLDEWSQQASSDPRRRCGWMQTKRMCTKCRVPCETAGAAGRPGCCRPCCLLGCQNTRGRATRHGQPRARSAKTAYGRVAAPNAPAGSRAPRRRQAATAAARATAAPATAMSVVPIDAPSPSASGASSASVASTRRP